jgi:hypothetical protein
MIALLLYIKQRSITKEAHQLYDEFARRIHATQQRDERTEIAEERELLHDP